MSNAEKAQRLTEQINKRYELLKSIKAGSISGIVTESFSGKPQKNATVMLFPAFQDTISKGNPMYVTKTDEAGNFELNYLKDMDYQILAAEFTGAKFSLVPFENMAFYLNGSMKFKGSGFPKSFQIIRKQVARTI